MSRAVSDGTWEETQPLTTPKDLFVEPIQTHNRKRPFPHNHRTVQNQKPSRCSQTVLKTGILSAGVVGAGCTALSLALFINPTLLTGAGLIAIGAVLSNPFSILILGLVGVATLLIVGIAAAVLLAKAPVRCAAPSVLRDLCRLLCHCSKKVTPAYDNDSEDEGNHTEDATGDPFNEVHSACV